MLTSNANEPVKTSADSPDTLPLVGYTADQLRNYVIRALGAPVWQVEITNQMILDCIQDALGLYSQWVPNIKVGNLPMVRGQYKYLSGEYVGLGITQVDFVEPNPVPVRWIQPCSYGNLLRQFDKPGAAVPHWPGRVRHLPSVEKNLATRDEHPSRLVLR